ncbi:hypothetical protein Glove_168g115 [Diversispora epigaea]|uniref:Uncharacterized protein n=1 Tax=Diversispora epigaea TaxID=1348612 RepID=A0A397IYX9_9GLOM|nr:hypothetical protein Glove_168g115 [Diversispora epigaea]
MVIFENVVFRIPDFSNKLVTRLDEISGVGYSEGTKWRGDGNDNCKTKDSSEHNPFYYKYIYTQTLRFCKCIDEIKEKAFKIIEKPASCKN